ncbi:MAG: TetR/AcrR family transcriptional regulator [Desulfovibrionaceae bacterium]
MPRPEDTKARLLQAARKAFAAHGRRNATIRDICALADANVAAVNYHFGSKELLYAAVLEDHVRTGQQRYACDAETTPESSPLERLRAYVRSFFLQVLGDGDEVYRKQGRLLMMEMVESSELFDSLFDRYLQPQHMKLEAIVRDMLPDADDEQVSRSASSIAGQCAVFEFASAAILRACPELGLQASNIERATEFITQFSLGGIARITAPAARP